MKLSPQDIRKQPDGKLLELYVSTGDMEYFGELYNRYIPLVYGLCLKYLRSVVAAEDAVMQIFEELAPKVDRFEVRTFRTWLYSVARNHCLQQLRRAGAPIPVELNDNIMESADVVHLLGKKEDEKKYEALERCVDGLPGPQRRSIVLFFHEERSYADIADITGYRLKSVKSYIQNAKRNLKICMEKRAVQ